jgi:hypothetical protein
MEAKLLKAYEELNRVEVERKRIEQIVKACEKNPPNNEEQIRVCFFFKNQIPFLES